MLRVIPEGAVEAAARAIFLHRARSTGPSLGMIWDGEMSDDLKAPFRSEAAAVLEAVAPHLMAQAWDGGFRTCRLDPDAIEFNPYRKADEDALREDDPEPQPGDGPDYHANHAFWVSRQQAKELADRVIRRWRP